MHNYTVYVGFAYVIAFALLILQLAWTFWDYKRCMRGCNEPKA